MRYAAARSVLEPRFNSQSLRFNSKLWYLEFMGVLWMIWGMKLWMLGNL